MNINRTRFILHIGLPRTGTSSIQVFLGKYADVLLREYSVLYPKTGRGRDPRLNLEYPVHFLYPLSILPIGKKLYGDQIDVKLLKNSLLKEIEQHKPRTVVLSAEHFSHLNKKEIKRFKELYEFPITDIIIYIRRQDLFIESLYRQYVRDHNSKLSSRFKEFVEDVLTFGWEGETLKYYEYLTYWKETFPHTRIFVRIYDKKLFPEGNVVLDFLSILGISLPSEQTKLEVNISLSHISTLSLKKINENFDSLPQDHIKVVNYLLELDRKEGSILKTFFTLEERIKFLEQFRESNEKLFREYFGTENQFVLSEEEIEFYRQQDQIPREVIEKAVEERYHKVLEFMRRSGIIAKEKVFPKVSVNYLPASENLDFFRIDVLQANLLNGRLIVSGLALPKNAEGVKLTVKDAEGVKEIQWGLPSPYFGEQRKDNPIAKNARFKIDNVVPDPDKPIEVYVNEKKVAEIAIKR